MPTHFIHSADVPPYLRGWVCRDDAGNLRYCATLWSDILKGSLATSTHKAQLSAIETLYTFAEGLPGRVDLDAVLIGRDVAALEVVLQAFLAHLSNVGKVRDVDRSRVWQTAFRFACDMLRYGAGNDDTTVLLLDARLQRLTRLYQQLHPTPDRPPPLVRALPARVLEDLYGVFDPSSSRNPFKTEVNRWRNFLVFTLLLQLGLRRGEAAMLPVNAVKTEYSLQLERDVAWLNVDTMEDEDPRTETPSLKNVGARRQLPLSGELVALIDTYVANYRGRQVHPFLLCSQKAAPLALRSLSEIFEIATRELTPASKAALRDQRLETVSAHDFRHTSAVAHMRRFRERGDDMNTATERLRVFFGWSRTSKMPGLYARAYFEPALSEFWNDRFDTYVDSLRAVETWSGDTADHA